jgi:DNA transposition AAA+ family ATPase
MNLTTNIKKQIAEAAQQYLKQHSGISAAELSRQSQINQGYLSLILNGKFSTTVDGNKVDISDTWFIKLADQVGFSITTDVWKSIPTMQWLQIINNLVSAKETGATKMIIGKTGYGKTFAIDSFVRNNPDCTYRITVSSLYKLVDIVNELTEKLGIDNRQLNSYQATSVKLRVDAIVKKLKDLNMQGKQPIIIFDEGENMEFAVLKMLKGLYDALKSHCSIVIIGTEQLLIKLLNSKKRNREAIPQLYRRFKAGQVNLSGTLDFDAFFKQFSVSDKGLQNLLYDTCENYGELHDYLQPLLVHAAAKKVAVSEDLFRMMYNMPKPRK